MIFKDPQMELRVKRQKDAVAQFFRRPTKAQINWVLFTIMVIGTEWKIIVWLEGI